MSFTRTPGLGRLAATPLAFGSVAGAGILSLPSAVYAESGSASLFVWVIAAVMCVPMLLMFQDAMRLSGDGNALQTLVARGLRPWAGAAMPLMFLFVVVVGLPTGCLVAGRYIERGLHWPGSAPIVAAVLLALALVANLAGRSVGAAIQLAGSAMLVVTGGFLVVSGLTNPRYPVDAVPAAETWPHILPGVLLAFWAFVGFENLTFLGRDLRNPARDFLAVSVIALAVYGAFAVALTLAIAASVDVRKLDPVIGLLQLASSPKVGAGVALVALAAMLINAAAWVRGVDQLVLGAARQKQLPARLAENRYARTGLLAIMFAVTITVLTLKPDLLIDSLAASSAVFVLIYLTCILAYIRLFGLSVRTGLNAVLIPIMATALVQSGYRSIYGLVVAAVCLAWCQTRTRARRASG